MTHNSSGASNQSNRFYEREHPYEWLAIVLLAIFCLLAGRWAHTMCAVQEALR